MNSANPGYLHRNRRAVHSQGIPDHRRNWLHHLDQFYPYAGCFIPNAILTHQTTTDCIAVMLEIHKRTYCDEEGNSIPEKLREIENAVHRIIVDCVNL